MRPSRRRHLGADLRHLVAVVTLTPISVTSSELEDIGSPSPVGANASGPAAAAPRLARALHAAPDLTPFFAVLDLHGTWADRPRIFLRTSRRS